MIFNYMAQKKNRKHYTFEDLDVGETFMFSDPRNRPYDAVIDELHSVYMVVDNNKIVDLSDGGLRSVDNSESELYVYPVICECSVSLYPDVY